MLKNSNQLNPGPDRDHLLRLLNGYHSTCLLVAAMRLGIFERLGKSSMDAKTLAQELGAHLPSLQRFLRALKLVGLIEVHADYVTLSALGRLMQAEVSGFSDRVMLTGAEYLPAWENLHLAILNGKPAFDQVFGMSAWEHRRRHPELNTHFNRTMTDNLIHTQKAVLASYDFSPLHTIVDVGGGNGILLAEILMKYPRLRGILFDQPHVIAAAPEILHTAGFSHRCQLVGGSFFTEVPANGEGYILQFILHDWSDEDCVTILRNCRAAMRDAGVIVIIENILPEDMAATAELERLIMLDLHMMTMLGGRERTLREFQELLTAAGLVIRQTIKPESNMTIIEAINAS